MTFDVLPVNEKEPVTVIVYNEPGSELNVVFTIAGEFAFIVNTSLTALPG
jgi:hypothetical protein